MKRLAAFAFAAVTALLSGCATDQYAYYDDDAYYEDDYYYADSYPRDRYFNDRASVSLSYGSAAYRYPTWGGYGYGPDYLTYNYYYSALWPTYRYYYDPFYSPGFYYGVTYFPRTYFGLNVGWNSWPYYHAYAPYRHSYADHYYDWWDRSRDRAGHYQRNGYHLPRYGSSRNEAQSLAHRTGARGAANAYYGASTQPGGIVDPSYARQARSRGQLLPFERTARDWNTEPYGRDGRGYRGFAEGATPGGTSSRGQLQRGSSTEPRVSQPYERGAPLTRSPRSTSSDPGYASPAPQMRERGEYNRRPIRDERSFDDDARTNTPTSDRYYSRSRAPSSGDTVERSFLPRQTRDRYDPMFERHSNADVDARSERQYEPRSRNVYRGQPVEPRSSDQPDVSMDRNYGRSQLSQPRYERSEPRYQRQTPTFERSERSYERAAPTFERSEPSYSRAAPTFQRSEPSYQRSEPRSAPSYSAPQVRSDSDGGGRGNSSSDDGGGRSSRGQLDRIIRDED